MKKNYLKPVLENIVVTPLCSIQAASLSDTIDGSSIAAPNETMGDDEEAMGKKNKFSTWDD